MRLEGISHIIDLKALFATLKSILFYSTKKFLGLLRRSAEEN